MTSKILSLSIDDDCVHVIDKVPNGKVSKFIREKILSDVIPTNKLILMALNHNQINMKDIIEFNNRLTRLIEARKG